MPRQSRTILLLFALLSTLASWAQPRLRVPEMYVGVHGGVTAATVQFSPTVANMSPLTQSVILGGNEGLVFRYSQQKCCAIQVELNYLQRGWQENNEAQAYRRSLHYIEIPLLMHLYFGSPRCRAFFNLGPQIGYCVYDDLGKGDRQSDAIYQYQSLDHPFDWGLAGGLGFYIRSRNAGLYQLEARFNYSLGTLYDNSLTAHFRQSNPMELSLNLAWLWEIKRR